MLKRDEGCLKQERTATKAGNRESTEDSFVVSIFTKIYERTITWCGNKRLGSSASWGKDLPGLAMHQLELSNFTVYPERETRIVGLRAGSGASFLGAGRISIFRWVR
jgi:hypothetical protein